MPHGRNRDSTSDSSGRDSDDGSGGGDTDNGSVVAKQYRDSSGDSDVEDNEGVGAELAMYYGKLDRVDDKEVTLKLNKETLSLFFSKILGKGELDREGRELLRDKYFMAPDQYKKLAPPDLLNTKLHLVKSLDFSGLSGMLAGLHTSFHQNSWTSLPLICQVTTLLNLNLVRPGSSVLFYNLLEHVVHCNFLEFRVRPMCAHKSPFSLPFALPT